MKFDEILKKRRSIRKFLSVPVEKEKIMQIIHSANEAPCAGNIQNWRFIVIQDEETKKKLASACLEQLWIAKAPTVIVVCSLQDQIKRYYGLRGEKLYSIQNCAAAIQTMVLEIVNLGLATCWVSAFDENAVARVLETPENVRPQAMLPVGYPGEEVPRPMRFTIEDIAYINRWGNKLEFQDTYTRDYHLAERVKEKTMSWVERLKEAFSKIFK